VLGEVAEHRQPGEGVDGIVRIVVIGHEVDVTAVEDMVCLGP